MPKKKVTYEQNITTLENILDKMEGGQLSLEESIALYTEGMQLAADCRQVLSQSKRSIEILVKDADQIAFEPFHETEDDRGV